MLENLVSLPLFKGVSMDCMTSMVGNYKFNFVKYRAGKHIFNLGDQCTDIIFLLSGEIKIKISNADNTLSITQTIGKGSVILPEFLFGRVTDYPGSAIAATSVSILRLTKADYMEFLKSDSIFLFNFLNILSAQAQKPLKGLLSMSMGDLTHRIALWVSALTAAGSYNIVISAQQKTLADILGVRTMSFLELLAPLRRDNIIDFDNTQIKVLNRTALIDLLSHHPDEE